MFVVDDLLLLQEGIDVEVFVYYLFAVELEDEGLVFV